MIYLHVSIANPNSSEIPRVPKCTTFLKIFRFTNSETRPPKINSPPKVQDDDMMKNTSTGCHFNV